MKLLVILIQIILIFPFTLNAQIAQFRGPERNGKFPGTDLLKEWPQNGPELLLEVDSLGKGYSSVIANDEAIFVTGMIDTMDYLSCIGYNGHIKWQIAYGESWKKSFPNSRCSPTIDGKRGYVTSGIGELACINAENGEIFWKRNVDKDYSANWHVWGVSESPLIVDDMVICCPSGDQVSIVALDKITGKEKWKSKPIGGKRAYSSPTLYEYNNTRYILANTANELMAINPDDGEIIWRYNYFNAGNYTRRPNLVFTNTPLWKEDQVFLSKGYNFPSVMLEIDQHKKSVSEKFKNDTLDNHHHGLVEVDNYIYASNWDGNRNGKWVCMNWDTGEIKYEHEWKNKGSIIYADGMLYCYEEKNGFIGLVKANPDEFELVSSFQFTKGDGPHWSHPYIYNGKLFLRRGNVMQVYNIAKGN